ncbi:MAG TPA: type II secretion system F family protein [Candidatus Angelobacter sp.]|nr:type II secretion system F family protein [Candidatus Angelobacter sp.]
MAEFLVKMADEHGRVLEQVESGFSETEVRDRFTQQGFLVYSIRNRGGLLQGNLSFGRPKLKADEFIIFNQQFITLIKAGLPILTGLTLLSKRQRNPFFKSLLENVCERVKSGELLSEAFAAQGQKVISKIYTTTLLAGERASNLEEVLTRYISYQKVTSSFRKKLISSLWYPALLIVALTSMLSFLITYVVPKFAELYKQFDADLPTITQVMLAIGTTLQGYFYIVVPVLAGLGLLAVIWVRSEQGAKLLDSLRFKVPIFGEVWMKYQVSMFSRTLATLLAGGMPLVSSLETASSSINSRKISKNVESSAKRVREGQALSFSLEETNFFPGLAIEMIEVGESTGALATMLNSVAEFYEEDVQNALTAALQLIEPVLLIFMACIVALVLIALYLPIFSIGSQIH